MGKCTILCKWGMCIKSLNVSERTQLIMIFNISYNFAWNIQSVMHFNYILYLYYLYVQQKPTYSNTQVIYCIHRLYIPLYISLVFCPSSIQHLSSFFIPIHCSSFFPPLSDTWPDRQILLPYHHLVLKSDRQRNKCHCAPPSLSVMV